MANTSSESDLGDDVVALSYERALRAHTLYRPTDKSEWPLTREARTSTGVARDEVVLPGATRGGSSHAQASEVLRNDSDLRPASVTIRLSKAECARLHKHAAEAGVTVSAYLRSCTFEAETLRAEVKAVLAELRTAGLKGTPTAPAKERPTFLGRIAFGWLARFLPRKHSPSSA